MTTDQAPGIRFEHHDSIGRVTIDNPRRRNAMQFAMWERLGEVFDEIAQLSSVRVVILTGAGEHAFCAGNDISQFPEVRDTPAQVERYDRTTLKTYASIKTLNKPTIARIAGVAVGGGFELTQLCDIQLAAASARFAMTPAKLGLGYKLDDVELLVERVGPRAASELLLTGRQFEAAEAARMGLINHSIPTEELDSLVDSYAQEMAANAPLSMHALKIAIAEATKQPPTSRNRALCDELAAKCNQSNDYREGQKAFAERRSPVFTGN